MTAEVTEPQVKKRRQPPEGGRGGETIPRWRLQRARCSVQAFVLNFQLPGQGEDARLLSLTTQSVAICYSSHKKLIPWVWPETLLLPSKISLSRRPQRTLNSRWGRPRLAVKAGECAGPPCQIRPSPQAPASAPSSFEIVSLLCCVGLEIKASCLLPRRAHVVSPRLVSWTLSPTSQNLEWKAFQEQRPARLLSFGTLDPPTLPLSESFLPSSCRPSEPVPLAFQSVSFLPRSVTAACNQAMQLPRGGKRGSGD